MCVFSKRVKSEQAGERKTERDRERERQSTVLKEKERERGMRGVRRKAVLFYTARACC